MHESDEPYVVNGIAFAIALVAVIIVICLTISGNQPIEIEGNCEIDGIDYKTQIKEGEKEELPLPKGIDCKFKLRVPYKLVDTIVKLENMD